MKLTFLTPQARRFVRGLIIFVAISFLNEIAGIAFAIGWIIFMIQTSSKLNTNINEDSYFIPKSIDREKSGTAFEGLLIDFGSAHYNHDPKASKSFFVQLKSGDSLREVWGVDLKRVIRDKGLSVGDCVELLYKGAIPIVLDERIPNSNETRKVTRYKNAWDAIKVISP